MDTKVRGAAIFMATPQTTRHLPQDIFRVTQLTGDTVLHPPNDTQAILRRISGIETPEAIAVQEEGLMKTQVMA